MGTLAEAYIKEGIEKGLKQGIEKGKLQNARDYVLEALEVKFGIVPDDIVKKVRRIRNIEFLRQLLKKVILSSDIDEFKRFLFDKE